MDVGGGEVSVGLGGGEDEVGGGVVGLGAGDDDVALGLGLGPGPDDDDPGVPWWLPVVNDGELPAVIAPVTADGALPGGAGERVGATPGTPPISAGACGAAVGTAAPRSSCVPKNAPAVGGVLRATPNTDTATARTAIAPGTPTPNARGAARATRRRRPSAAARRSSCGVRRVRWFIQAISGALA